MLFQLGRIVATPGALEVAARHDGAEGYIGSENYLAKLIGRHARGDWGDMDAHDKASNDQALRDGNRLFSAYGEGSDKLYVITEWDRSVTTVLRPDEY